MSDEGKLIFSKTNVVRINSYYGNCHGCNSPVFYDGDIVVAICKEDEIQVVVVPIDGLVCPFCQQNISPMILYKNMNITSELSNISHAK